MSNCKLDLIVFFNNKNKQIVLLDYYTDDPNRYPEIGCEIDPRYDWVTDNEDLLLIDGIDFYFNMDKAFNQTGVYKVYGNEYLCQTPDGDYYNHNIHKVELIQEINY